MTRNRGFEVISKYKDEGINLPARSTENAAGYDFEAAEDIIIPSIVKLFKEESFSNVRSKAAKLMGGDNVKVDGKSKIRPTLVPTGIKAYMQPDEVLILANRSSGPIKQHLILTNGIGIIDSDYYNNEGNEGHIMFQFVNYSNEDVVIKKGDRIGQGMFQKFLITDDDVPGGVRKGGHGSTGK